MPGLIEQKMPQEAAPQPGQPPAAPQQGQQADPKAVERVVLAALKILHDPKITPQILQMMKAAGDPVQALAQATLLVMRQLFAKSKQTIPPEVLGVAGVEVMDELAMIANKAGLYKITPQILQQAVQAAVEQFKAEAAKQTAKPAAPVAPAAPVEQPVPEEE